MTFAVSEVHFTAHGVEEQRTLRMDPVEWNAPYGSLSLNDSGSKSHKRAAFNMLVVAVLLCILSSQAADALQCTGGRLDDGQFSFNASYEVKEDISDCETQWLVDEKLAGLSDANGDMKFIHPIVKATANTAILQTCPEKFECLLICPAGNIIEKQLCSCDATPPTTLPEGDATPPTTLPEVDFPNWGIGVLIGASAFVVLVTVTVTIVLRQKIQRHRRGYSSGSTDTTNL